MTKFVGKTLSFPNPPTSSSITRSSKPKSISSERVHIFELSHPSLWQGGAAIARSSLHKRALDLLCERSNTLLPMWQGLPYTLHIGNRVEYLPTYPNSYTPRWIFTHLLKGGRGRREREWGANHAGLMWYHPLTSLVETMWKVVGQHLFVIMLFNSSRAGIIHKFWCDQGMRGRSHRLVPTDTIRWHLRL